MDNVFAHVIEELLPASQLAGIEFIKAFVEGEPKPAHRWFVPSSLQS